MKRSRIYMYKLVRQTPTVSDSIKKKHVNNAEESSFVFKNDTRSFGTRAREPTLMKNPCMRYPLMHRGFCPRRRASERNKDYPRGNLHLETPGDVMTARKPTMDISSWETRSGEKTGRTTTQSTSFVSFIPFPPAPGCRH